ncbi:MAG: glycosyltransferase [Armatimonadetes bacterium]|nr:glycosyltransferase [Armatimonadota bacterium]
MYRIIDISTLTSEIEKYQLRKDLNEQIYKLNFVCNEDLVALYKKTVALVMPTFFGPTNIPQLEAFALGCPVITSDIYGIPDQVGDAALLVNPSDYSDIANKIKIIWNDKSIRQKLVRKGYKKDIEWNQKQFSLKLGSIIEEILN